MGGVQSSQALRLRIKPRLLAYAWAADLADFDDRVVRNRGPRNSVPALPAGAQSSQAPRLRIKHSCRGGCKALKHRACASNPTSWHTGGQQNWVILTRGMAEIDVLGIRGAQLAEATLIPQLRTPISTRTGGQDDGSIHKLLQIKPIPLPQVDIQESQCITRMIPLPQIDIQDDHI